MVVVVALAALLVGLAIGWLAARGKVASLQTQNEMYAQQLKDLDTVFYKTSKEVFKQTIDEFKENEERIAELRSQKIDQRLEPFSQQVEAYNQAIQKMHEQRIEDLNKITNLTEQLMDVTRQNQSETSRLSTLLGRSSHRGRFGEVQLENVLRASHLVPNRDYTMQVTTDDKRPDCVIAMPNGTQVVIDAKFPFDAFEAGFDAEDPEERVRQFGRHAEALKSHVRKLKSKEYWAKFDNAPEMVILFVPSDEAVSVAFEHDKEIADLALNSHVIIAGPGSLVGMLSGIALVLQAYHANANVELVAELAGEMYERVQKMVDHLNGMGTNLSKSVASYNDLVGSVERNVITQALKIRTVLGNTSKEISAERLEEKGEVRGLSPAKWDDAIDDPTKFRRDRIMELPESEFAEDE
jgi:DNA recombination protein RmuC